MRVKESNKPNSYLRVSPMCQVLSYINASRSNLTCFLRWTSFFLLMRKLGLREDSFSKAIQSDI